ncbi:MAG: RidA family protein, partial [Salinirussus sp.]
TQHAPPGPMEKIVSEPLDRPFARAVATRMPEYTRVFVSGAVAPEPDTEAAVAWEPEEIRDQTRATLDEIESYVNEFDGGQEHIVRVRPYLNVPLTDEHYAAVNEARADFFRSESEYPASTVVEVENLTSEEYLIEIDADAVIPDDDWEVTVRD